MIKSFQICIFVYNVLQNVYQRAPYSS